VGNAKIRRVLPEYGSDEIWVINPADLFDLSFYNPADAFFTGFAPADRRQIRPINPFIFWNVIYLSPLTFFSAVPADSISVTIWFVKYMLRNNITYTIFPELEAVGGQVNEPGCLPPTFKVPDTAYGCKPPTVTLIPPAGSPELMGELVNPAACIEYVNPVRSVEGFIQVMLTPSLGPFVINGSTWFQLGIDLVTMFTTLEIIVPGGVVPEKQAYCILSQVFAVLILIIFGFIFGWGLFVEFARTIWEVIVDVFSLGALFGAGGGGVGGIGAGPGIDDTRDELRVAQKKQGFLTMAVTMILELFAMTLTSEDLMEKQKEE